jgi:hypothetical protein
MDLEIYGMLGAPFFLVFTFFLGKVSLINFSLTQKGQKLLSS